MEIKLKNANEKDFEYHLHHHDHFKINAGEMRIIIGGGAIKPKGEYNKKKDFGLCYGIFETAGYEKHILLMAGDELIIPAGIPHKPGLSPRITSGVEKETADIDVVKIPVAL